MSKTVYSKQNAHVAIDGNSQFLAVGEPFDSEDPVVLLYPSMFTDDASSFKRGPVSQRATETASADPGERRDTKPRG